MLGEMVVTRRTALRWLAAVGGVSFVAACAPAAPSAAPTAVSVSAPTPAAAGTNAAGATEFLANEDPRQQAT